MFGLEDQTWDVEMLCVCERVVYPSFKNFCIHLNLVVSNLEAGAGSGSGDTDSFLFADFCDVNFLLFVTTVVAINRPAA